MDDVFQQFLTSDITYLEVRERERNGLFIRPVFVAKSSEARKH